MQRHEKPAMCCNWRGDGGAILSGACLEKVHSDTKALQGKDTSCVQDASLEACEGVCRFGDKVPFKGVSRKDAQR